MSTAVTRSSNPEVAAGRVGPVPAARDRLAPWRALALPALLLVLWQLWALGLPADTRAPYPSKVASTLWALTASGDLPLALVQSLGRVMAGFACAPAIGLLLGVPMGARAKLRDNLDPHIEIFPPIAPYPVPPTDRPLFGPCPPAAVFLVAL